MKTRTPDLVEGMLRIEMGLEIVAIAGRDIIHNVVSSLT